MTKGPGDEVAHGHMRIHLRRDTLVLRNPGLNLYRIGGYVWIVVKLN